MTYNALRKGRVSLRGQVYLVTSVTAQRERFFEDPSLAREVVTALRTQDLSGATRTLAFVVMPDHVHWLFELAAHAMVSRAVKQLKGSSAVRINLRLGRKGSIWQPSFHDHALRDDECLISAARYVIMNPVRAALVKRVGDYSHWDSVWDAAALGIVDE